MTEYQYAKGDVVYITNVGVCIVVGLSRGREGEFVRVVVLAPAGGYHLLRGEVKYYPCENIEKVIASGPNVKITARWSARKFRVGEVVQVAGLPGVYNVAGYKFKDNDWIGVVMAAHRGESEGTYDILRINSPRHRPIERVTHQRLSAFQGTIKVDKEGAYKND